jgi:ankyrin repeat protein
MDNNLNKLLSWACRENDYDSIIENIRQGADVNNTEHAFGKTPLILITGVNGDLKTLKRLVEAGADVNYQCEQGTSSLDLAMSHKNIENIRYLLEKGANPNTWKVREELYGDDREIAELLIEFGLNFKSVHKEWDYGEYDPSSELLMNAMEADDFHWFQKLLKAGANVNYVDRVRWTPLMVACYSGNLGMVRLVIESGADVNFMTDNYNCALFTSLTKIEVLKYLVEEQGCSLDIKDRDGADPIQHAIDCIKETEENEELAENERNEKIIAYNSAIDYMKERLNF